MNILVTNDDGIESQGLWALAKAMSSLGEVTIIAPDQERSGVGSCLSMRADITINEIASEIKGVTAYAVGGTPGDCVMLGTRRNSHIKFDLVVSGINPGPNIGTDVHYSGTVMATLEAYHQKIPSIAVSLYSKSRREKMEFNLAAEVATKVASQIMDGKMKTDAIFNINVPNIKRDQIKGILITKTASKGFVTPAKSGSNNSMNYAFELEELFQHGTTEGTDIHAIQSGYISISLLRFEVDHRTVEPSIAECLRNVECDLLGNFG